MSLLMDALKRAEEAKRQGAQQQGAGDHGLSLEPRPGEASPLPDLSSHIESVDADLQAEAASHAPARSAASAASAPAPGATSPSLELERESARQVFAAKQALAEPESSKGRILTILGVGTLACLSVGGYFWFQYQQVASGSGLALGGPVAPAPMLAAPPTPITAAATTTPVPSAAVEPVQERSAESSRPLSSPQLVEPTAVASVRTRSITSERSPQQRRAATNPKQDASQAQQIAVAFGTSPLDTALAMGYSAMNRGDLDAASIAYQEVLRQNPRQLDALLGLSAIAANRGDTDRAAAGYFKVLEIDPRNPSAHVGLLGLGAAGDVNQRESRLRSLLSQQPPVSYESGMLQFGLGNLYASQQRWSDAQQSFFSAHASDSGNPDYLYNLAVSLDHLQQRSLALRYYEAARSASESRAASFNAKDLSSRISELSRQ